MENRVLLSGLSVTNNTVATDLVSTMLGAGVTSSNETLIAHNGPDSFKFGDSSSSGTFTGGNSGSPVIIGFESGIILSTGGVQNVTDANFVDDVTQDNTPSPGDLDLDLLAGVDTFDATVLEFDFVPVGSTVSWNYVFSSEEYNEFVDDPFYDYNDVFAFYVNGVNAAVVPLTTTPITVETINNTVNSAYYRDNEFATTGSPICTEMDGLTVVLTATANVNPNVNNHIKLAIADGFDPFFDSNVFIEAASFTSEPDSGGDNAPVIDSLSATSEYEDDLVTLNGTFHDDDTSDTHTISINWNASGNVGGAGEGTTTITTAGPNPPGTSLTYLGNGDWSISATHQYLDDNPTGTPDDLYDIAVTVTDASGNSDDDSTMTTITNVAPTIAVDTLLSVLSIDETGTAILRGTITDPGTPDVLTLKVNWGDPLSPDNEQTFTFTPPHTPGGGMHKFTLLHTYRDDNPSVTSSDNYTITLTVSDDDLGVGDTTTTVTVNNLAPTANADGPDAAPAIGQPFSTDEDTPFVTASILTNDTDPAGSFNPLRGATDDIITIVAINPNLNGQSNKDPQWNPVFFNEKSSKIHEKKKRSLATHGLKAVRARGVAELWIRSAD